MAQRSRIALYQPSSVYFPRGWLGAENRAPSAYPPVPQLAPWSFPSHLHPLVFPCPSLPPLTPCRQLSFRGGRWSAREDWDISQMSEKQTCQQWPPWYFKTHNNITSDFLSVQKHVDQIMEYIMKLWTLCRENKLHFFFLWSFYFNFFFYVRLVVSCAA